MDGLGSLPSLESGALVPPEAPLARPIQRLGVDFRDTAAPGAAPAPGTAAARIAVFVPPLLATAGLMAVMLGWFDAGGIGGIEAVLIALICFNFFWITLTVSTVALGLVSLLRMEPEAGRGLVPPQKVALLMPIYHEDPAFVMGNAQAILEGLDGVETVHSYCLFILSDTRDEDLAQDEARAVARLRAARPGQPVYYRRRVQNTDRKVGNIADWLERWGADYPAMLVLDADSLMTGEAIVALTDALARDPSAGLIQSYPHLIGARTLFARAQQFASGVYGAALAEGLARWTGSEANYWGHNAILRTAAFARSAGLPHLRRGRRRHLIMSHDFVEAGLMRRAGWAVRFLPRIGGSYEETPPTLLAHVARDRRWCQGNLQHLRLLGTRGLHTVSRFHLLHGAMGYVLSPLWFCLLVVWALLGNGEDASVLTYFSEDNPLLPAWPEMTEGRHVLVLLLMYAMLLMPKVLGIVALRLSGVHWSAFGGARRFGLSVLGEVALSVAYAPVLMVQQMIAVLRVLTGVQGGWGAQTRGRARAVGMRHLVVHHGLETVSGVLLLAGIALGVVTWWLLPIALSLAFAVPLSAVSGADWGPDAPWAEPGILRRARRHRAGLRSILSGGVGS